ncbi:MAG: DUF4328 domain-containing protein [Pseudomonadota bacterium]
MSLIVHFTDGRNVTASTDEVSKMDAAGLLGSGVTISNPETGNEIELSSLASDSETEKPDWRPVERRHDRFKGALIGFIIVCVLMIASNFHAAAVIENLVNRPTEAYLYPEQVGAFIDLHQGIISLLYLVVYVLCFVFFAMFFFRAQRNLKQIKAQEAEMSPGWIVGWNFVPLANFFMPFSGVRQNWQASRRLSGEDHEDLSLLQKWWAAWLVAAISSNIFGRFGTDGLVGEVTDYGAYVTGLRLSGVSDMVMIVATIILIKIIKQIDDAQAVITASKKQD